jgi:hypothetical protein
MSDPTQAPTLASTIQHFKDDVALVHDFVKGDKFAYVVGEDGAYPSLAKIAADAQSDIQLKFNAFLQGMVIRHYRFNATDVLRVKHNLGTTIFDFDITNNQQQKVYAPWRITDNTEFIVDFTEREAGLLTVRFYLNA